MRDIYCNLAFIPILGFLSSGVGIIMRIAVACKGEDDPNYNVNKEYYDNLLSIADIIAFSGMGISIFSMLCACCFGNYHVPFGVNISMCRCKKTRSNPSMVIDLSSHENHSSPITIA